MAARPCLVKDMNSLRPGSGTSLTPRTSQARTTARPRIVAAASHYGATKIQGSGRAAMEDTFCISSTSDGSRPSFFGVFDGHGGDAVAELLKTSLWPTYEKEITANGTDLTKATRTAYLKVDQLALAQPKGIFGALRERGVGGSRCGASAATAVLMPAKDGSKLVAANVGDARVVLSRGGNAVQLSVTHTPEVEAERQRIESKNPTPKKPLVVKVGDTWRIGGLLSLSRAFGDAYLKDWSDGKPDGAGGGFGLTAEPDIQVENISPGEDKVLIVATDGLWERLTNQEAVDFCLTEAEKGVAAQDIADRLAQTAQQRGSTDDIAVIVVLL